MEHTYTGCCHKFDIDVQSLTQVSQRKVDSSVQNQAFMSKIGTLLPKSDPLVPNRV